MNVKIRLWLVFVLLLIVPTIHAQMVMLPISVQTDKVTLGPEFIPTCNAPLMLKVPAGQTVTLADGTFQDCIQVSGTLALSRTHDTTAKFTTLIVMPGGSLDFGSPASPIPASVHVELIIRNVPINLQKDPFQWGNGIINFSTKTMVGAFKTRGALIADAPKGATTLTLLSAPIGWAAGDEIYPLDTHTHIQPDVPDQETGLTIAAIAGTTITLSKPLEHAYTTIKGDDGSIAQQPEVLNLSSNFIVRSEDPLGTPGHTVEIGDGACPDIENVRFEGLGRTRAEKLDNTSSDLTHSGDNQIGKYNIHFHWVQMSCSFQRIIANNVVISKGPGKWGVVIHHSHDARIIGNVALGFPGAGFVTEDGSEVRNVFDGDIAAHNLSHVTDGSRNDAGTNIGQGCPGCEGTGHWYHGIMNTFNNLEAWGNTVGLNLFNSFVNAGFFPSTPGGTPDLIHLPPYQNNLPFQSLTNFKAVGNTLFGNELWATPRAPIDNLQATNNYIGVILKQSEDVQGFYRNPRIIQSFEKGDGTPYDMLSLYYSGSCVKLSTGYVSRFEIEGGYLNGCPIGVQGTPATAFLFTNTKMQNAVGINFDQGVPAGTVLTNVTWLQYGLHPKRYLQYNYTTLWSGTGPYPPPINGATPPEPQPDPMPPMFHTLSGVFQQLGDLNQFQFCPSATPTVCQMYVKP